jgi:hypothetical protein
LLDLQDTDGRWSGALYSPRWTSTTYTLLLLHWLGLPTGHPQALAGCRQVWDGASFYGVGLNLAKTIRQPETCITAMLILLASSFRFADARIDPAVGWLLDQQLDDGGGTAKQSAQDRVMGRSTPRSPRSMRFLSTSDPAARSL